MKPIPKYSQKVLFWLFMLSITGCKDFVEPDITGHKVVLIAPANEYQSTSYTVNFWWEEVHDALTYRLQIVSPGFNNTGALVTDTVIKGNKFAFNLSPGEYEWRVRAENGSTQTEYSNTQNFSVLFSSIKQQKVQLKAPVNNILSNQPSLAFSWGSLYGATKYRLQIDTNNFVDERKVVYDQLTPALQTNITLPKDQLYKWRVKAENDTAQAQWSAINIVTVDHTPPPVVALVAPTDNQTIVLPLSLQWTTSPTATKYRLYIYKGDSASNYNETFPVLLTTNSYSWNQGAFGERIYWKVTAIDAAGNESAASVMRSFVLQ